MDNVLAQAYLPVSGYVTIAEYPMVEARPAGGHLMATDLDILGFRFDT